MTTSLLPPERDRLFRTVRQGLPLAVSASLLLLGLAWSAGRAWLLVPALALLAEVLPTFRKGRAYLDRRPNLVWRDGLWVRGLRPLFRAFGFEEAWVRAFCAWNNRRVREAFQERRARRALVLLPHCIQLARCKADVVGELSNCYECGLCTVEDILQGRLQRRWETRLTNRSHKAYREAREFRPDLIVAVSCTDRLVKGLLKLPEIPSYVIPLELPYGMCVDTTFSVPHLHAAMETLVEPRSERGETPEILPLQPGVSA